MQKPKKNWIRRLLLCLLPVLLLTLFLQTLWAHRDGFFTPNYPKVDLLPVLETDPPDWDTILAQTGLGQAAAEKLLLQGHEGIAAILQYQDAFFSSPDMQCAPLLGWFTREDRLRNGVKNPPMIAAEPGDILLTLSTHSMGWRHGHAALVLTEGQTLESLSLGLNSQLSHLDTWRHYSNYAILRVKDSTPEERAKVAKTARETLLDIPYRLTVGLIGPKAAKTDNPFFGVHCGYLVWYAWQAAGVDLDSDHGAIVTPRDMLQSNRLEVVQIYGLDPRGL